MIDSDSEGERPLEQPAKKEKSRRPPNTAFRQQRLKAWQPILTPKTVLPLFFTVTCVFALFGGLLIWASNEVQEIVLDYTHCGTNATESYTHMPSEYVDFSFKNREQPSHPPRWKTTSGDDATCTLRFHVPTEMGHPVYMFYRLTNFYQNHRRYVLSYNERQLNGFPETAKTLEDKDDCKPLIVNGDGKPYYPCGLIANSMFNDTFSSPRNVHTGKNYTMTREGIAWSTDRNRFKRTQYNASDVVPPPNWVKKFPHGYTKENLPDIATWEEFQNWMRTAGLPTFSKLALRNDNDSLEKGTYEVSIGLNFDTTLYNGKKFLVISTRTAIGGKNPFLGIAYCVVAGLCAVLGLAFLIQHIVRPRRLGDHTFLSWNQDTANATRR